MIGGQFLGAYALSEAQAGSDISGMTTRAKRADHGYELNGAKAWTHPRLGTPISTRHLRAPATILVGCELLPCARTGARTHLLGSRSTRWA